MEDILKFKKCPTCKTLKSWAEFSLSKERKNGLFWRCKVCDKQAGKERRKKHPGHISRWNQEHPEEMKALRKSWEMRHPEYNKAWRAKNFIRCKNYAKLRPKRNKTYSRNYMKLYRKTPRGNLDSRMSAYIRSVLRKGKSGRTWQSLVGYTLDELKSHIESQFTNDMTWEVFLCGDIHIDHVIPKSRFHYEKHTDPEFRVCWGLSNLQPMWKLDNLSKHAKTMEEWKQYKEANEKSEAS